MELRQTMNKHVVNGLLLEKVATYGSKDGKDYLSVELSIETTDGTYVTRSYQRKLTKDGKENPMYKSLDTVAREYKAVKNTIIPDGANRNVANVELTDREQADYVSVEVEFSPRDYMSKRGNLVEAINYRGNKINRISKEDTRYPIGFKGNFEGCVTAIEKEKDYNGVETGRLNAQIVGINYGGKAVPLVVAIDADIAEGFLQTYSVGQTAMFSIKTITVTKGAAEPTPQIEKAGWGRADEEEVHFNSGFTVVEYNCFNGGMPYAQGSPEELPPALVTQALQERQLELQTLKANAQSQVAPNGNSGIQMNPTPIAPQDLPF